MRIPVVKIVDGEKVAFPLPGCTDIVVRLCSAYRRLELAYTIDAKEDNVIVARVEGDRIPLGTYALEVRGKIFGNDWRSNEYEQVAIVDRNADADTELGETDEGENSVEMDTAVVVLPPDRELEALVKEAQAQNKAMSELSDAIKVSEEGRVKSEELRAKSEEARQEVEKTRATAEDTRARTEAEREANEQARQADETARKEAESEREAQERTRAQSEERRAKSEESRVKGEELRVAAETKREDGMAEAINKANAASEVAVTANEPFVWEPFKDLEHWNITAMDLATGTVTLDTEEHGLAVGDLVTLAVNITEWSGIYKIGRQWDSALGEKRIVNFPVTDHSAIPVVAVTAVNGAEVQCDRLKRTTDYQVTPSDWQLQRAATGYKMVDLPDRYIGKPVTITIESQYTNHISDWAHYNSERLLVDSKGSPVAFGLGDGVCGVPIFKTVCSIRSGYVSRVDIGNQVYKEHLSIGLPYQATTCASKNGHFDIRQGKALRISKVMGHYAARVIVEPYRELTELGGVNSEDSERKRQLVELIEKQKLQFGVDLVDSNEYTVPETDIQTTNFNIVDKKTITTLLAELQCAFTPQDDLYVVIGGQNKFVFGQKGGRLVITSKDAFEGANEYTDLEDMGAAADGEYHRYRLYVDGGDEGKVTLDVDGVRVKEMDYVTGKVIANIGTSYGCMGFLGQSIRWNMSYRPPMGVKLKGLQTIVTADANKSKLVSFAPCAGTNWLAYFDTAWYPQMNGANYCSFKKWPSLANGYNVQSTTHVPWLGAVLTNGDRAWVGCADDKWAQVAP